MAATICCCSCTVREISPARGGSKAAMAVDVIIRHNLPVAHREIHVAITTSSLMHESLAHDSAFLRARIPGRVR